MDLGLEGRTVIVTGASGGIGREIARTFAAEGADVVLTYRKAPEEAERVAKEIGGRTMVAPYDLADPAAATALVGAVLEWTGRVDVLINNAVHWGASAPSPDRSFEEVPDEEWLAVVRGNIEGSLRLARAVAPVMRERRWGRMVHISSTLAVTGAAGSEYYTTAKAALHGFNRSVAHGLGRDGDILSNVVMPGFTRTERNVEMVERYGEHYGEAAPIKRLLDASEIATPVVFLGSAANTGITGRVLAVDGGTS